ncbi:MAG TPA: acyloxyacyl hydrolase [Bacteroidales bacterium]|nr:acyloxyacyl hydrolase [Bacteroidales bacterium]HOR60395.1 acyloxyacyl hydrolase [Bacteroidales bacterium]HPL04346.1 acyloxyacyl hydrolase [Bacteroidales bacterium]
MKRILLFVILIFLSFFTFSQKYSFIEGKTSIGKFVPHHRIMNELIDKTSFGFEVNYLTKNYSDKCYNKKYNFPYKGFGLSFYNLGNPEVFGYSFSAYGLMEFNLAKIPNFEFNIRCASGLSYLTEKYDEVKNPYNVAIGTNINYLFILGFNTSYQLGNYSVLRLGADFMHNSNGSTRKPNLGVNQVFLSLSYSHLLLEKSEFKYSEYSREKLSPHEIYTFISFCTSDEYKEIPESRGGGFLCSSHSLAYNYQYSPIGKVGVSHDIFYNENLYYYYDSERDSLMMRTDKFSEILKYGISFGHQLIFNRLELTTFAGFYYYQQVKKTENFYTRIGARYYLSDYLFINLTLRAFGFKAHFIESGIGVSFRKLSKTIDN